MDANKVCSRIEALKSKRTPHESVWAECFDYTHPIRAHGLNGEMIDAVTGQRKRAKLLDGTGTDSANILASALKDGATPANSRWFALSVSSEAEEDIRWLDQSAEIIWQNIHGSNYDAQAFDCVIDLVCAGWFVLYIDEDLKRGGYRFEQWPLAQCYISSTDTAGRIDTIYRTYTLTAAQCVAEYGETASEEVKRIAEKTPEQMIELVHCITPNDEAITNAMKAKNLPFKSYKFERATKNILSESGYHEFPCVVPRWTKIPDSFYAVGAVYNALPDMKQLNAVKFNELAAQDLAIGGMWIAEDDGVLNPRTVKIGPRRIIVANSINSMKELRSGADFNVAFTSEDRLQAAIRKTLLADQLQPQGSPQMTAYEVSVRLSMIRQLLGPQFARMQTEWLQAMIERCFGIAYRAGVLGRAPEGLAGRSYFVRYQSPLARAQKMEDLTSIERYEAGLMQVAQAFPQVLDNYDADKAARRKALALGVPMDILPSAEEVAATREQRAAQQQQQMQQMQQQQMIGAAANAAQQAQ